MSTPDTPVSTAAPSMSGRVVIDRWRSGAQRATNWFFTPGPAWVALRWVVAIVVFILVVGLNVGPLRHVGLWHAPLSSWLAGLSIGTMFGIVAVGIILIYRTYRIINFAAAAIGAVPAILALLLDVQRHIPYLAVFPIALVGGPLVAALVDVFIMRRFNRSPRMIVMVVTVGVAQGLAILGFFIPVWIGARAGEIPNVPTPWDTFAFHNARNQGVLTGNDLAAFAAVAIIAVALGLFLRYTRIGIAIRASAENADRASLLGIPVQRVQTIAWALAGLLAAIGFMVYSPLVGVPNDATLGFDSLLYALAAAVIARMERLGVAVVAGMGMGVIEFAVVAHTGRSEQATAVALVIILVALLFQRRQTARAMDAGTSSWEAVKQYRPIPTELRALPEVNTARVSMYGLAALLAIGTPFVMYRRDLPGLAVLPLFGIVAVSLVVLSGWAGQISLGQFGIVGFAAAVAGGMVAKHNIDFFAALVLGIAAGVVAAVLIGLPAVRIQGMYLAVTTLAFGYAMQGYVLNKNYWLGSHLLPTGLAASIRRPLLYGRINLENERTFYFVCLVALVLAVLAALAFRRNRSGRVLIAARDNQRAAPAYAINLTRTRLAAFAVSGGIAGMAGTLFAYQQHNVIPGTYGVLESVVVFLAAVIGGITSVPWAVAGAVGLEAITFYGPHFYEHLGPNFVAMVPLLLTGPLLVLNLYFYTGGSAESGFALRDKYLRWVARRHGILVPSLVADRRAEDLVEAERDALIATEQHVEEIGFDVLNEPTISCPVCGVELRLSDAPDHAHLRKEVRA